MKLVGRLIIRISQAVDRFCRSAAVGFLAAMLLLVLFQVIARYIFRAVPVWTEEAARYCMVWGGLLGATVAFRRDADPRLVQPPKSGPKWKTASAFWLRAAAAVIFLYPILNHAQRYLSRTWVRTSDALGIPLAVVTVAVPLFVAVIFLHILAKVVESRGGVKSSV